MDVLKETTSAQFFSRLKRVRLAIVGGIIMFAGVVAFLIINGSFLPDASLQGVFNMLVPALALSLIGASMVMYKTLIQKAKDQAELKGKVKAYRAANIMRLAMLDGPSLLAIVATLLTGQLLYLIVPVILIAAMLLHNISAEAAANELDLQYPEKGQLEDPEHIIFAYEQVLYRNSERLREIE